MCKYTRKLSATFHQKRNSYPELKPTLYCVTQYIGTAAIETAALIQRLHTNVAIHASRCKSTTNKLIAIFTQLLYREMHLNL
jgi:hypothetical protein